MAAVAAAGPLTMVAALTGPEIKKPRTPAGTAHYSSPTARY